MAYNEIADTEIDLDSPITVSLMTKIRDNIEQNRDDLAALDVAEATTDLPGLGDHNRYGEVQAEGTDPGEDNTGTHLFSVVTDASLSVTRTGGEITITLELTKLPMRLSVQGADSGGE